MVTEQGCPSSFRLLWRKTSWCVVSCCCKWGSLCLKFSFRINLPLPLLLNQYGVYLAQGRERIHHEYVFSDSSIAFIQSHEKLNDSFLLIIVLQFLVHFTFTLATTTPRSGSNCWDFIPSFPSLIEEICYILITLWNAWHSLLSLKQSGFVGLAVSFIQFCPNLAGCAVKEHTVTYILVQRVQQPRNEGSGGTGLLKISFTAPSNLPIRRERAYNSAESNKTSYISPITSFSALWY